VVAVLDERLGLPPVTWPRAARAGVHLVHALRPHTPVPEGVSMLDLAAPAWSATAVDQTYVRALNEYLGD
jgi:hypothetical protein